MKTFKFRNSSSERAEINIDQLRGAAAVAYDICTGRITVPAEQRTAEQISGNRLRTMFIAVLGKSSYCISLCRALRRTLLCRLVQQRKNVCSESSRQNKATGKRSA